jgi:hypothetical protein
MKTTKNNVPSPAESLIEQDHAERQLALEYIAEAWNTAEEDGVEQPALAHASLFAAITMLVRNYGEEVAAELVTALPDRIRSGEYSLERQLQ